MRASTRCDGADCETDCDVQIVKACDVTCEPRSDLSTDNDIVVTLTALTRSGYTGNSDRLL